MQRQSLQELVQDIYLSKSKEDIYLKALKSHSPRFLDELQEVSQRYSSLLRNNKQAIGQFFEKFEVRLETEVKFEGVQLHLPKDSIKEEVKKSNKINDTIMTLGKPNDFRENFFFLNHM